MVDTPDFALAQDFGIFTKLYIEYNEHDNLSNLSMLMLDIDPDIKTVVLSYEYSINPEYYARLKADFTNFKEQVDKDLSEKFAVEKIDAEKQALLRQEANRKKDIIYFLKKYHEDYFKIRVKALEFNNENNYVEIDKEQKQIEKIISFRRIKAKRDVANEDAITKRPDKTLSKMSSKYYDRISNVDLADGTIKKLQNELSDTDDKLNVLYNSLFASVIDKVKRFGGIKEDDSKLKIISSLEEKNLLTNNTTVMYKHNPDHSLPEDYNGLGYMNLISMIFEIEVLLNDFKKKKSKEERPADINLLFIEEPEAHTHPQMQYVSIKNITTALLTA